MKNQKQIQRGNLGYIQDYIWACIKTTYSLYLKIEIE